MAIKPVKGTPYTTYVIEGSPRAYNIASQFANLATRAKREALSAAQQQAKIELERDIAEYQADVQRGIATYKQQQTIAERMRKEQKKDRDSKEKRVIKLDEQIRKLTLEQEKPFSTGVGTSVSSGGRIIEHPFTRSWKQLTEENRMLDERIGKNRAQAAKFASAPALAKPYEDAADNLEAQKSTNTNQINIIEKKENGAFLPGGAKSIISSTTTRGRTGISRADRQSYIDALQTEKNILKNQRNNLKLELSEPPKPIEQPELRLPEPVEADFIGRTREAAREKLRLPETPVPPQQFPETIEEQRQFLLDLPEPERAVQPQPMFDPSLTRGFEAGQAGEPQTPAMPQGFESDRPFRQSVEERAEALGVPESEPSVVQRLREMETLDLSDEEMGLVQPQREPVDTYYGFDSIMQAVPEEAMLSQTGGQSQAGGAISSPADYSGIPFLDNIIDTITSTPPVMQGRELDLTTLEVDMSQLEPQKQKSSPVQTEKVKQLEAKAEAVSASQDLTNEEVKALIDREEKPKYVQGVLELFKPINYKTQAELENAFRIAYAEIDNYFTSEIERADARRFLAAYARMAISEMNK
jgi:hypothetical protein